MQIQIREMRPDDWPQVREIYREGIETGHATFETEIPDWEEWDRSHIPSCRPVSFKGEIITGWAGLSPTSKREAYSGVAEVSIYVKSEYQKHGIGSSLLQRLIEKSEKAGFWTLQAAIFPENQHSIRLHKAHGFREVGIREKLGKLRGKWRDVILLERRSETIN